MIFEPWSFLLYKYHLGSYSFDFIFTAGKNEGQRERREEGGGKNFFELVNTSKFVDSRGQKTCTLITNWKIFKNLNSLKTCFVF